MTYFEWPILALLAWDNEIPYTKAHKMLFRTCSSPFFLALFRYKALFYYSYECMKYFSIFILSFFTFSATSCKAQVKDKISVPQKSYVKVVADIKITECVKEKKDCPIGLYTKSGSGAVLHIKKDITTVMTAGHVCSGEIAPWVKNFSTTVSVIDYRGFKHQSYIIKSSTDLDKGDLCVLRVPSLKTKALKLSKVEPRPGDFVHMMASPAGVYHPPVVPVFNGIYSGQIDSATSMTSIPAMGGASGGAILNKNNKIVGVLFAVNGRFHHITLVSSYQSTLSFVSECLKVINDSR